MNQKVCLPMFYLMHQPIGPFADIFFFAIIRSLKLGKSLQMLRSKSSCVTRGNMLRLFTQASLYMLSESLMTITLASSTISRTTLW
jgi:hypothetical protein